MTIGRIRRKSNLNNITNIILQLFYMNDNIK